MSLQSAHDLREAFPALAPRAGNASLLWQRRCRACEVVSEAMAAVPQPSGRALSEPDYLWQGLLATCHCFLSHSRDGAAPQQRVMQVVRSCDCMRGGSGHQCRLQVYLSCARSFSPHCHMDAMLQQQRTPPAVVKKAARVRRARLQLRLPALPYLTSSAGYRCACKAYLKQFLQCDSFLRLERRAVRRGNGVVL